MLECVALNPAVTRAAERTAYNVRAAAVAIKLSPSPLPRPRHGPSAARACRLRLRRSASPLPGTARAFGSVIGTVPTAQSTASSRTWLSCGSGWGPRFGRWAPPSTPRAGTASLIASLVQPQPRGRNSAVECQFPKTRRPSLTSGGRWFLKDQTAVAHQRRPLVSQQVTQCERRPAPASNARVVTTCVTTGAKRRSLGPSSGSPPQAVLAASRIHDRQRG